MKPKWDYIKGRFPEIKAWLNGGANEKQIIKNLGISKTTFEKYKKEQPELIELLKSGVKKQVDEVVNSLYKAAKGYHYTEEVAYKCKEVYYDTEGRRCEREEVKAIEIDKFQPPNQRAAEFFLINKDKANWKVDPSTYDLKREELDQKKRRDEFGDW